MGGSAYVMGGSNFGSGAPSEQPDWVQIAAANEIIDGIDRDRDRSVANIVAAVRKFDVSTAQTHLDFLREKTARLKKACKKKVEAEKRHAEWLKVPTEMAVASGVMAVIADGDDFRADLRHAGVRRAAFVKQHASGLHFLHPFCGYRSCQIVVPARGPNERVLSLTWADTCPDEYVGYLETCSLSEVTE